MEVTKEKGSVLGPDNSTNTEQRSPMKFFLKRSSLVSLPENKEIITQKIQRLQQKHYCLETLDIGYGSQKNIKALQKFLQSQRSNYLRRVNSSAINTLLIKSLSELANKIGTKLKRLQSLHLDRETWLDITDNDAKTIKYFMRKSAKTLQNLSLDFSYCEITDEGVLELVSQMGKKFSALRNLKLDFSETDISYVVLEQLAKCFSSNLRALQSISFLFWGIKMTDKEACYLINEIRKNCQAVKVLDLNFGGLRNFTDRTLQQISDALKDDLKSLRFLALDFSYCEDVTRSGFNDLIRHIGNYCQTLQALSLCFVAGDKVVTDEELRELSSQTKNLRFLKELSLNFSSCDDITEEGVQVLVNGIQENLQGLQDLNLEFDYCLNIWDVTATKLEIQLKNNIKSLQNIRCVAGK